MPEVSLLLTVFAATCAGHLVIAEESPQRTGGEPGRRPPHVHDPSTIVKCGDTWWCFSTGFGVSSWRSADLVRWERGPDIFDTPPKWISDVVPDHRGHFWAPDVIHHRGRYLVYYSVSTFGKQTSAIALASSPTLDPHSPDYRWTDHRIVIQTDATSDFNAIDPAVVHGDDDTLWMAFGSFWSGIKLIQLDPATGLRIAADSPIHTLAHKEQIEAVALYRHAGHWYQFVNWGWCCRGAQSTYNIRVGRSRAMTGPYVDREGVDLREGGGSLLLETEGRFIGPGHAGIVHDGQRRLISFHFYDGEANGRPRLAIRPLDWDEDGWPRVSGAPITPPEH